MEQLKEQMENLLYPELRPYRRSDRDRLLREARETPFDFPEWAGILAALAIVVPKAALALLLGRRLLRLLVLFVLLRVVGPEHDLAFAAPVGSGSDCNITLKPWPSSCGKATPMLSQ